MDIKTDLKVTGSHTIKNLTTAGFVKNTATGLFSSNAFGKACARCTTAQSLSAGANTLINLNESVYDTEGNWVDLSNDRICPKIAGYYIVTVYANVNVPPNYHWIFAAIFKDGGTDWKAMGELQRNTHATTTTVFGSRACDVIYVNGTVDNWFEFRVYCSAATTLYNAWYSQSNFIDVIGPF